MRNTLTRASRSGVVNIARDFSCCIVSADDEILQWAENLPIQVLCGPGLMARSMKQFIDSISRRCVPAQLPARPPMPPITRS